MPPTHFRSGDCQLSRKPPPTPIATGKGLRSAVVDDEIFSEYLETSLKVPSLTLPHACFPSRPSSPTKIESDIDLSDIAAGDETAIRWLVAAAAEAGGFVIDGGDVVTCEEVRPAVEAGAAVFESMAARRRGLVSRFGIGEEISWYRCKRKEMEPLLEDVPPDTYRAFRERMEVMAAKLEMVADCISYILCEHVRDETHSHRPPKMQSVLCLRKHRKRRLDDITTEQSNGRDGNGSTHCLSIHLPILDDCMFRIHSSVVSAPFSLPAGSILVTIGQQLKEWCNGEYRTSVGEMLLDPKVSPDPLFSMEFIMYSIPDSDCPPSDRKRMFSLMDQLLLIGLSLYVFLPALLEPKELRSINCKCDGSKRPI